MNLATKDIELRPASDGDLQILYKWRNADSYRALFQNRRNVISPEEFRVEYKRDVERQRHVQFMIVLKKSNEPIGLIYSYNASMVDGYVFMGIYMDDKFQNRGYGAKASILFIKHLFDTYPIHKICLEIFSYNTMSFPGCQKLGFVKEGELVRQRFYFGKHWNVIRLALFRENTAKVNSLFKKLTSEVVN